MNEIKNIKVNNEVLIWARDKLALSQTKAAESIGISISRLRQLESGAQNPSLEELKSMAKTYKRTIATLLLVEPPKEKPLPNDRRTVDSKELNSFHPKTILAVRKARALAESLIELKKENGLTVRRFIAENILGYSDNLYKRNPREIAQQFRKEMNLDYIKQFTNIKIALEAYIEKVEDLGIAVFQISLTEDELRGFSLIDEELPVIVVKRGDQPTAKIFTLFHELGHIILNENGLCNIKLDIDSQQIEKWCNAFAGEILIPKKDLLAVPQVQAHIKNGEKKWSKNELIQIGTIFHVGPLALLRSLLESNLTDIAFYKEKHKIWSKPAFARPKEPKGRDIPKETITERGRSYINLAFSAFEQNRIDLKDLSDYLGIKLKYINKTRELLNSI